MHFQPFHGKRLWMLLLMYITEVFVVPSHVYGQQAGKPVNAPSPQQSNHQIEILHADFMTYDKSIGENVRRLTGHVQFMHENAVMFCDSAYHYADENNMDAFGHIRINQGDTLQLYGDFLKYFGKDKLARMIKNVVLVNRESILRTQNLDFDLGKNYGYYFHGGEIENGENRLKSKTGYYYATDKTFFFKTDVKIINPKYIIDSDTLKYNTVSKIAWFYGPTHIVSKEDSIYCENGWYNTDKDISQFNKNASLKSKGQLLTGDSLYYDRNRGFGEAFHHVVLYDSSQNAKLRGNYGYYYEQPERGMLTGRAELVKMSDEDTIYIHSDTIRSTLDTLGKKVIRGYYHTKMFKTDLQGMCDSIVYSESDSTVRLFGSPAIWSDENQITSDYINIYTKERKIDYIEFINSALIVSQKDTIRFDQIKGKKMTGYFSAGQLSKIVATGNGQTIYFPVDGKEIIGMNKAESSNIVIYLKDRKVDKIVFLVKPAATLYPLNQVQGNDMKLADFKWFIEFRPKTREDIFNWNTPKEKE